MTIDVPMSLRLGAVLACFATQAAAAPAYDSGGTGSTAHLLNDSFRAAYHGRYSEAIADDTKAISIAPNYGRAYLERASHEVDAGRYAEALADLNRVIAMHPDDFYLQMLVAELLLAQGKAAEAMAKLKVVTSMGQYSFWHDPYEAANYQAGGGQQYVATGHAPTHIFALSSIAEQILHQDDASINDMTHMLSDEGEHKEYVLAYYCWHAAVAGLLDAAEMACQRAIELNSHDIGQYDSLGFTYLRMKAWDKAIAAYNTALDKRSDLTTSLYGRGIARRAKGDVSGGNADMASAAKDEPDIANIMRRLGAPAP